MVRPTALLVLMVLLAVAAEAADGSILHERSSERQLRLRLPPELGETWSEASIGRLQVRTARKQVALDGERLPKSRSLEVTLEGKSCSLVQVDLGAPSAGERSDAWQLATRCTKIVACARTSRRSRQRSSAVVTAKTGSRIEIRPLLNPAVLVPGSDLPVRLYFEGESVPAGRVEAVAGSGARQAAISDRVGIAFLRIPVAGDWTVRFSHRGTTAELVFDVLEGDVQER